MGPPSTVVPARATEFGSKSGSIAKRHHRWPTTNSGPRKVFDSWTKYSALLLHHRPAGAANMSSWRSLRKFSGMMLMAQSELTATLAIERERPCAVDQVVKRNKQDRQ
jgi:hypothetical protein